MHSKHIKATNTSFWDQRKLLALLHNSLIFNQIAFTYYPNCMIFWTVHPRHPTHYAQYKAKQRHLGFDGTQDLQAG